LSALFCFRQTFQCAAHTSPAKLPGVY
jgi:hypothetical protein